MIATFDNLVERVDDPVLRTELKRSAAREGTTDVPVPTPTLGELETFGYRLTPRSCRSCSQPPPISYWTVREPGGERIHEGLGFRPALEAAARDYLRTLLFAWCEQRIAQLHAEAKRLFPLPLKDIYDGLCNGAEAVHLDGASEHRASGKL